MVGLPATGELSYNGVVFGGDARIEVQVNFLLDDAKISVKAHEITITVRTVIVDDTNTDPELTTARRRLGQSGKTLVFTGKGFGNIRVGPGGVPDLSHGPTPKVLLWSPIGDNKAVEIEWQVTTVIASCLSSARTRGIESMNWSMSFSHDEAGDTTRTITGYIEIALNKIGHETADDYLGFFVAPPLPGFKRTRQRDISPDQKRLNFSITDTQIPSFNVFPKHVIDISGTHRVSWRLGKTGNLPVASINVTIEPEANVPAAAAWNVFLEIAKARIGQRKKIFITGLELEENLFGRPQSFRIEYKFKSSLRGILARTGLWRPLPGSWSLWARSLEQSMFSPRGGSQLRDIAANHVIVDLCSPQTETGVNNRQKTVYPPSRPTATIKNEKPTPEDSYLEYENDVYSGRRRPVTIQSPLQSQDKDDLGSYDPLKMSASSIGPADYGSETGIEPDIIQVGGASRYSIRMAGRAVRVGYQIARPHLKSVGSQTPVEVNQWFVQRELDEMFGVPVYIAMWMVDYAIPASPGVVPTLPDLTNVG
jgi:hypothetical protein